LGTIIRTLEMPDVEQSLDVQAVMAKHGDFLWRSLQRLGVRDADLPDVMQEVLIVIHRKLGEFDQTRPLEPWLFALCAKTSSTYRRSAYNRREVATDPTETSFAAQSVSLEQAPDAALEAAQLRAELDAVLDRLVPERRALLVMFEIEQLSCEQIARVTGIPKGTVFSRLHAARKDFARALARHEAMRKGER
jgi:RNA polymerase sigma-70 factor (ECF subfamily)